MQMALIDLAETQNKMIRYECVRDLWGAWIGVAGR